MLGQSDRTRLLERLKVQIKNEFTQAMHAQGLDTRYLPDAWRTLKALEERVTQHAEAITQTCEATLEELESLRQQHGIQKTFLGV
jgi:hypothetical protein